MEPASWEYGHLMFHGLSLAGVRTSITLPQHSLAFDVAQGLPYAQAMNTFLITHGHMDHAAGIPYLISQKAMSSHGPARFIMPTPMVEPLREIMRQWTMIEGHEYPFKFIGVLPGQDVPLKPDLFIRPFPTLHRVPSQGYSLFRQFRKLRSGFTDLSSGEIGRLRREGIEVTEAKTEILVSFTGDTQIEFLDLAPHVRHSKILMLEVTYLDERRPVANARAWGHTHFDELIPRLPDITSEKIVLIHTSARYSLEEAQGILNKRLPPEDRERVVLFPGR